MSKRVSQIVLIWLLLGIWPKFAQAQATAEVCLSEYLAKYHDFYQEFALVYRGETYSVRKSGKEEKERLLLLDGLVAESASRNIRYAASTFTEPNGKQDPSIMEELTVGGKLFTKAYGTIGNTSQITANNWGVPSETNPTPKITPCIQPHGLALLRDTEMRGRESEFRSCVPMFLKHKRFVEESEIEKGGVRGNWLTHNKALKCTIDFSTDEPPLPVKVIWEYVGDPGSGISKSTTTTKWKKDGDVHVPSKIEIASQLGEGTTEVVLEFVFLKKERFEKEIKEIEPTLLTQKAPHGLIGFGAGLRTIGSASPAPYSVHRRRLR